MTNRKTALLTGIIGYTSEGRAVITPTYCCPEFAAESDGLCPARECWYCHYSDFRKDTNQKLEQSICHNAYNQSAMQETNKIEDNRNEKG